MRGLFVLILCLACLAIGFVAGVKYEQDNPSDQLRLRITRDGEFRLDGTRK